MDLPGALFLDTWPYLATNWRHTLTTEQKFEVGVVGKSGTYDSYSYRLLHPPCCPAGCKADSGQWASGV